MNNIELLGLTKLKGKLDGVTNATYDNDLLVYIKDSYLTVENIKTQDLSKCSLEEYTGKVLLLKYLRLHNAVVCVMDKEILIMDLANNSIENFKPGTEIATAAVNPLETTIIVVYANNLIHQYYLVIRDMNWIPFGRPSDVLEQVPNSVYVGWGAQETQFKGYLADVLYGQQWTRIKPPFEPPTISWRGNGEYFVINYWHNDQRYLKVFDADCYPKWVSKSVNGLLPPVSFKNEGNMIATVAIWENLNHIIVFEKNCLPKYSFSIDNSKGKVDSIQFHPHLPMLTVLTTSDETQYLNIYDYSNGKWYLKQQLRYSAENKIVSYFWDDVQFPYVCQLWVITAEELQCLTFKIGVSLHKNYSIVANIDGADIKFTWFKDSVIPPPLYSYLYKAENPINKVEFHPTEGLCVVIDAEMVVTVLKLHRTKVSEITKGKVDGTGFYDNRISWSTQGLNLYLNTKSKVKVVGSEVIKVHCSPKNFTVSLDHVFEDNVYVDGLRITFRLGALYQFYINDIFINDKVNSYIVFKNHLLYTTTDNQINYVKVGRIMVENLTNLNKLDSICRSIELGAKIVCVTANRLQTVLQMPRGNLELISIQLMGVDKLENLLQQGLWTEAVEYVRSERLNPNLLIDQDICRFEENLEQFLAACQSPALLSQICMEIKLENTLKRSNREELMEFSLQKQRIMLKIKETLENSGCVEYLNTIITILMKHFSLSETLKHLCSVHEKALAKRIEMVWCERAVALIRTHTANQDVFKAGALLFNLEFLRFIMRLCNYDPMEYEEKLAALEKMSEVERRYEMCMWADDKQRAVKYLLRIEKYDADFVIGFVSRNSLYEEAYQACPSNLSYFKEISKVYGQHLSHLGRHNDGAFVLKRAGLIKEALELYRVALNWSHVMYLAHELNYTREELDTVLEVIANRLLQMGKVEESVLLYETVIKNYLRAIEILLTHKKFRLAANLALANELYDIMNGRIKPAVNVERRSLLDKIIDLEHNFKTHYARLITVRSEKIRRQNDGFDGGDGDIYSDTETMSSRSSGSRRSDRSTMSSRGKRKEDRKKTDLKHGGKYEDIALMRALYIEITEAYEMWTEYNELLMFSDTVEDHNQMKVVRDRIFFTQSYMMLHSKEIWPKDMNNSLQSPEGRLLWENLEHLDVQYRTRPAVPEGLRNWRNMIVK